MSSIERTNYGSFKGVRSYITTDTYDDFFFSYNNVLQKGVYQGVLAAVPGAVGNSPAGRILRETGRKLVPGANANVSNYLVGVYDAVSLLTGFIDPNARVFEVYNSDKPHFLPDDDNTAVNKYGGLYGSPVLTAGNIIQISTDISGNVTPSYMGVVNNLDQARYAEMYHWHGDSNMYIDTHDHATGNRAYLSSEGRAIVTKGLGYKERTVDTQYTNTHNTVHSSSNTPTGIINLAAEGFSIAAYGLDNFTLYNSTIGTADYLSVEYASASSVAYPGSFRFSAECTAPSTAVISMINNTGISQYPSGFALKYILFKTSDTVSLEP